MISDATTTAMSRFSHFCFFATAWPGGRSATILHTYIHTYRYTESTSAKSREDAAKPLVTVAPAARGGRMHSSSRLFAKATYKNFGDMLEKEPGAILVDFYAT